MTEKVQELKIIADALCEYRLSQQYTSMLLFNILTMLKQRSNQTSSYHADKCNISTLYYLQLRI